MQAVVTINAALWRNLPAEKRIIIAAAARMADEEARGIMVYLETTAYRMLAEEHGLKIVDLTDEQLRLWRICSSDTLYEFMEKSGSSGQQLMVAYGRMRATSARATRMESKDFHKAQPVKAAPQPAPPPEIGLMRAKAAPAVTASH
jgi:TRAP-type mannitol/chloroaromatic compound transport system substrate-binding protein